MKSREISIFYNLKNSSPKIQVQTACWVSDFRTPCHLSEQWKKHSDETCSYCTRDIDFTMCLLASKQRRCCENSLTRMSVKYFSKHLWNNDQNKLHNIQLNVLLKVMWQHTISTLTTVEKWCLYKLNNLHKKYKDLGRKFRLLDLYL